jgi:hypothetical protein
MSQPVANFKVGSCQVSVFENERRSGTRTFRTYSIALCRRYRDDSSGEWKSSSSLVVNEIPRMIRALERAFDFCTSTDHNNNEHAE